MFSGFPADSCREFRSELGKAEGENGFERLSSYYDSVVDRKVSGRSWNIEERLDSENFFYYPFEKGIGNVVPTCFENGVHFLMAATELYPSSNPRLAYLDQGERGIHSFTMFNHEGRTYGGDFNYKLFCPIDFNGSGTIGSDEKNIKFKSITPFSDSDVKNVIGNLRGKNGCKYYFSEGGQTTYLNPYAFRPHEVFTRLEDGKLISESRFRDFGLINNSAVRRIYNMDNNEFNTECLAFSYGNWMSLADEVKICWNKIPVSIGENYYMDGYSNLKDLKSSGVDNFVKQFGAYHNEHCNIAKGRHRKLEDAFVYLSKSRRQCFEDAGEGMMSYVENLGESSFKNHVMDYFVFLIDKGVFNRVRPDKSFKSWKEVNPGRGFPGFYSKYFFYTLFNISKKERKMHMEFDRKILDLLRK